jgi:hypothetical protein
MIAAATAAMNRAVFPNGQTPTTKLSLAVTPLQPLGVSAANIAAMEVSQQVKAYFCCQGTGSGGTQP